LEILASAEKPHAPPRDDPYLALAVVGRAAWQARTAPRWAEEVALSLVLGRGHAAADRGALAAWILETRESEGGTLAARLVEALVAETDVTLAGATAAALALLEEDASHALAVASSPAAARDDERLALVRALALRTLGRDEEARADLQKARPALARDSAHA